MSKVYSIKTVQFIAVEITEVWNFFSTANNLQKITPPEMRFKIKDGHTAEKIYAGQIIEYIVRPVLNIPLYWMTEITHVQHEKYFVDEQRFGPYSLWHHQHHFKEVPGGVEMTDLVHYKIPFWFLGDMAHAMFIRKKLYNIFLFRQKKIDELFSNNS